MLICLLAGAQGSFSVKLKLVEAKSGEPVGFATASLTRSGEKSPVKYVLTDDKGEATLTKVGKGT